MLTLVDGDSSRLISEAELPLALGGAGAELRVPEADAGEPLAWLDLREREDGVPALLLGPSDRPRGEPLVHFNGAPLVRTTWLHAGDLLRAGSTLVRVESAGQGLSLVIERAIEGGDRAPWPEAAREPELPDLIHPIEFVPRSVSVPRAPRRFPRPAGVLTGLVLLLLLLAGGFLLVARVVTIQVDPRPEELRVSGAFLSFERDGRHLMLSGEHRLRASAEGYLRLDTVFVVGSEREQSFRFALSPLPGMLQLELEPKVVRASLSVDGGEPRSFEGEALELEAGRHVLLVIADGYLPQTAEVLVRGRAERQLLRILLVGNAARLSVASEPAGATVRIDGTRLGTTPLTIGLESGAHDLELSMPGRQLERRRFEVVPGRDLDLGVIALARSPGRLSVTSTPAGAAVSVDGSARGTTPLQLSLPSERVHLLRVSAPGYRPQSRELKLDPGEGLSAEFRLEALLGRVRFDVAPANAELLVDGRLVGAVPLALELPAVAHELEIRAVGHEPFKTRLTPDAESGSLVSVSLRSLEAAKRAAQPLRLRNAAGLEMILIEPGAFQMGASRREPGRRSNEKLRAVEITRPFYLASTEVTNAQFAGFDRGHSSGALASHRLDADDQPVVQVSWQQAARFCNWLSSAEALPLAYREDEAGELVASLPLSGGYRLPTEAEWEWAARVASDGEIRRYSWGDSLPPPPSSANLGDSSAASLLPRVLQGFTDGQVVSAPVASYPADRRGLFDMTGNVAEWTHDVYTIPPETLSTVEFDPQGPETGELHSVRGASFLHSTVTELRLSFRDYGKDGRPDLGFRVARFADQGEN